MVDARGVGSNESTAGRTGIPTVILLFEFISCQELTNGWNKPKR